MILEIIESYDKRIEIVNNIIEGSHELLGNYRKERESTAGELRETLAQSGSLRHKDFDGIMATIYQRNDEYEKTIKAKLKSFIKEHHAISIELKNVIETSTNRSNLENKTPFEFIHSLETIKQKQSGQEQELHTLLKAYQTNQNNFLGVVSDLIEKKSGIHFSEVKKVLNEYSNQVIKKLNLNNNQNT